MSTLDRIKHELATYDAVRPRSQQVETGASGIYGCRAQTLLRLTGVPPTEGHLGWQALVGTAVHDLAERAAPPEVITEQRFQYRTVWCTIDRFDPGEKTLTDLKTKDDADAIAKVQRYGPSKAQVAQVQIGAAALIAAGYEVETVELLFLPRAGSIDSAWLWSAPFDRQAADDAADWAAEQDARAAAHAESDVDRIVADLDGLRDEPERFCRDYCDYATLCRGPEKALEASEDPFILEAAETFAHGKSLEAEGKAIQQSVRPVLQGVTAVCGPWKVQTSGGNTSTADEIDLPRVLEDYKTWIGAIPLRTVEKTSAVSLRVTKVKTS